MFIQTLCGGGFAISKRFESWLSVWNPVDSLCIFLLVFTFIYNTC